MKFPDVVKIGGHQIPVETVRTKNIDSPGEFNNYYRVIRIRSDIGIPESVSAEAFLHELIEVVRVINNLELDHTHLTVLSEGLFQIIRDNNLDFLGEER